MLFLLGYRLVSSRTRAIASEQGEDKKCRKPVPLQRSVVYFDARHFNVHMQHRCGRAENEQLAIEKLLISDGGNLQIQCGVPFAYSTPRRKAGGGSARTTADARGGGTAGTSCTAVSTPDPAGARCSERHPEDITSALPCRRITFPRFVAHEADPTTAHKLRRQQWALSHVAMHPGTAHQ